MDEPEEGRCWVWGMTRSNELGVSAFLDWCNLNVKLGKGSEQNYPDLDTDLHGD